MRCQGDTRRHRSRFTIKKILVSRTDKIGDLVLSIPSFYMLRKMYPEAGIGILVRHYNYELASHLPYIDVIIKIDEVCEKELTEKIRAFGPDVFIALFSDTAIARLARKSGAAVRIGPYSKPASFFSYNCGVWQKRSRSVKNEAEYNLDLVKRVDFERFQKQFVINTEIFYEKTHAAAADRFLRQNGIGEPFMVVHPFCGGSAKNLRDFEYAQLLKRITERFRNLAIVITAGPDEIKSAMAIGADSGSGRVAIFSDDGVILNTAALIDRAALFMGPSTGPTHIAGALKKKIIAIYAVRPTHSPVRWGVFGTDTVEYVCPEGDIAGDYSLSHFNEYGEKDICKIIDTVEKFLAAS